MIKKLFFAWIVFTCFTLPIKIKAQCSPCTYVPAPISNCSSTPPKPRGLYVNEFFEFNSPFYGPPSGIDVGHSILAIDANRDGVYEKEDALLTYCQANKFTRISLYDISNILNFPTVVYGNSSYQEHLKRFITKAKTGNYGITDVGVTIWNPNTPALVATYNGISSSCIANKMALVEGATSPHSYFKEKEMELDLTGLENNNFYTDATRAVVPEEEEKEQEFDLNAAKVDNLNAFKIDHMVSEFEFWNTKTYNTVARRDSAYKVFEKMMNFMKCIRSASFDPLYIYVYLGYLDKDSYDDKLQAQFIDGIADRIFLSNYKCNPNSLFQASIQNRIDIFSNSSGKTKANTKLVILFCGSSQSDAILTDPLNDGWCDFLGPFLKIPGNTMACAENMFKNSYDAYKSANPGKWNSTLNAFQWYPYTLLKKNSVKRLAEENHTNIAANELFSAYPNPTTDEVNFSFTLDEMDLQEAFIEISDVNGKLLKKESLQGLSKSNLTLSLNAFNSGIYFCKLRNSSWSSATSKLVVIK